MERDCESELSKLNIEQNACIYHFGASVIHGQRSNILRLQKIDCYLPKLTIYFYRCYATRYRKLTADLGLTLRGSERPGLTGKRFFCISVSTSGGEMSFRRK